MKIISTLFILFLTCTTAIAVANSDSPEGKGLKIAIKQKAQTNGWQSASSELKMILHSKSGSQSERLLEVKSLEVDDDGDKNLMVFKMPRDVQGTAFLSHSHIEGPDDQWIYLPALKRVKRISSRTKSGSFMGSEFSYEDLASFEIEKYTFTYIKEEACGELTCHVIENTPKDDFSGYSKLLTWVDTEHYRLQKAEFYDKRERLLKVMQIKEYQLLDNKFWRPRYSIMENVQSGNKTELYWNNIQLNIGLDNSHFTQNQLKIAD